MPAGEERTLAPRAQGRTRPKLKKLIFDVDWKNENRNILPNIMSQLISFLLKKDKCLGVLKGLFVPELLEKGWTPMRLHHYIRKIKDSMSHYVNENTLESFLHIHEPDCNIYTMEEQEFYLKACRVAIAYFLKHESVLVTLTSSRMSAVNRHAHLIARRALEKFFRLLAEDASP